MGEEQIYGVSAVMGLWGLIILLFLTSCGSMQGSAEVASYTTPPNTPPAASPARDAAAAPGTSTTVAESGPAARRPLVHVLVAQSDPAEDLAASLEPAQPVVAQSEVDQRELDPRYDFFPVAANRARDVDFYNDFTYLVQGYGQVTVTDGHGTIGSFGEELFIDFNILDVVYGDLDGDDAAEAAITVGYSTGGNGFFTFVQVFAIDDRQLRLVGSSWLGDRSHGGIAEVAISDGLLLIDLWDSTLGSCCPDAQQRTVWTAGTTEQSLRLSTQFPPRTWLDLANTEPPYSDELTFRADTTSAILEATNDGSPQTFRFAASGGHVMRLTHESGEGATLRIRNEASQVLVGDVAAGSDLTLVVDGRYTATVLFAPAASEEITLDLVITDPRTLAAPTWTTKTYFDVTEVDADVHRQISMQWPVFTSAHPLVDLDALNATIDDIVTGRLDAHLAEVDGGCNPEDPAIFDLRYRPTLVSYDLLSIAFNEFVCLCRNGDEFRDFTVTIDLNTGEVLTHDDLIVDSSALASLWWESAQVDQPWAFEEVALSAAPANLEFSDISLTATHAVVTIADGEIDGLGSWVNVALPFDELGGVINAQIATRAISGADVLLPYEESCGC